MSPVSFIPDPCPKKWNELSPANQGRHCTQCGLVVRDFAGYSNDEILAAVRQSAGKVCGRVSVMPVTVQTRTHSAGTIRRALALFALAFGLAFSGWSGQVANAQINNVATQNPAPAAASGTVMGTVTIDGSLAESRIVVVRTLEGRREIARTETDVNGKYVIKGIPVGEYKIEALVPGSTTMCAHLIIARRGDVVELNLYYTSDVIDVMGDMPDE